VLIVEKKKEKNGKNNWKKKNNVVMRCIRRNKESSLNKPGRKCKIIRIIMVITKVVPINLVPRVVEAPHKIKV
jgi:hypothetical protein